VNNSIVFLSAVTSILSLSPENNLFASILHVTSRNLQDWPNYANLIISDQTTESTEPNIIRDPIMLDKVHCTIIYQINYTSTLTSREKSIKLVREKCKEKESVLSKSIQANIFSSILQSYAKKMHTRSLLSVDASKQYTVSGPSIKTSNSTVIISCDDSIRKSSIFDELINNIKLSWTNFLTTYHNSSRGGKYVILGIIVLLVMLIICSCHFLCHCCCRCQKASSNNRTSPSSKRVSTPPKKANSFSLPIPYDRTNIANTKYSPVNKVDMDDEEEIVNTYNPFAILNKRPDH
jgi:hypothetical protein